MNRSNKCLLDLANEYEAGHLSRDSIFDAASNLTIRFKLTNI